MSRFVEVFVSWELGEIICVRAFLHSRDIETQLLNEHHMTQSSGALAPALGGYRLIVAEAEATEARRLLKEAAAEIYSLDEDFDESDVPRR